MFVEIGEVGVRVGDAGNLRSLSVKARQHDDVGAAIAAVGAADPDGEHVWLRIDDLRALALGSVAADEHDEWSDGFEAMISFARSKGWTSEDHTSVRAHVERT